MFLEQNPVSYSSVGPAVVEEMDGDAVICQSEGWGCLLVVTTFEFCTTAPRSYLVPHCRPDLVPRSLRSRECESWFESGLGFQLFYLMVEAGASTLAVFPP